MALPNDILSSLQFPAVTNARASQDYMGQDENWNQLGPTGLFYWALGIRPSKDNFWTTSYQPNNTYNRISEPNPELITLVAALSTGPVGFSDGINFTNAELLMKTCRKDGLLLQPSKPLTSIDASFAISGRQTPAGSNIFMSYSTITSYTAYYLLAVDVNSSFVLNNNDFWPSLQSQDYYYRNNNSYSGCSNLTTANSCIRSLLSGYPDIMNGNQFPNGTHQFDLWTFTPFVGGWSLLGELDKFTAVAPERFDNISFLNGISFTVNGVPNEIVNIWLVQPNFTILQLEIIIPSSGSSIVQLTNTITH